ncbi:hypothetical protein RQM65_17355 [Pricia sp. S334]|uniref:DUF4625 domain-containing protein n=1 Tax=Pricia mediterranea TaxID=3076079 RepID=A0ABU3LB78_9FLAO|nr:hypothetical protein [Pricia sp. S334]MDT7830439.1 hypothetical protein [Pricia sp. S334]
MKHIANYIIACSCSLLIVSCNNDENDIVPDFLDGTEYGVLLDVIVTSDKEIAIADLDDYSLDFIVEVEGDKRPVQSIAINKVYIDAEANESPEVPQQSLTEFPKTLSLTSADMVEGFSGLSTEDLRAGDSFNINFVITYEDGAVIDKFDSSMRTNFAVLITE